MLPGTVTVENENHTESTADQMNHDNNSNKTGTNRNSATGAEAPQKGINDQSIDQQKSGEKSQSGTATTVAQIEMMDKSSFKIIGSMAQSEINQFLFEEEMTKRRLRRLLNTLEGAVSSYNNKTNGTTVTKFNLDESVNQLMPDQVDNLRRIIELILYIAADISDIKKTNVESVVKLTDEKLDPNSNYSESTILDISCRVMFCTDEDILISRYQHRCIKVVLEIQKSVLAVLNLDRITINSAVNANIADQNDHNSNIVNNLNDNPVAIGRKFDSSDASSKFNGYQTETQSQRQHNGSHDNNSYEENKQMPNLDIARVSDVIMVQKITDICQCHELLQPCWYVVISAQEFTVGIFQEFLFLLTFLVLLGISDVGPDDSQNQIDTGITWHANSNSDSTQMRLSSFWALSCRISAYVILHIALYLVYAPLVIGYIGPIESKEMKKIYIILVIVIQAVFAGLIFCIPFGDQRPSESRNSNTDTQSSYIDSDNLNHSNQTQLDSTETQQQQQQRVGQQQYESESFFQKNALNTSTVLCSLYITPVLQQLIAQLVRIRNKIDSHFPSDCGESMIKIHKRYEVIQQIHLLPLMIATVVIFGYVYDIGSESFMSSMLQQFISICSASMLVVMEQIQLFVYIIWFEKSMQYISIQDQQQITDTNGSVSKTSRHRFNKFSSVDALLLIYSSFKYTIGHVLNILAGVVTGSRVIYGTISILIGHYKKFNSSDVDTTDNIMNQGQIYTMMITGFLINVPLRTGWLDHWYFKYFGSQNADQRSLGTSNTDSNIRTLVSRIRELSMHPLYGIYQLYGKFLPSYVVFVILLVIPIARVIRRKITRGSDYQSFDPELPNSYYIHTVVSLIMTLVEDYVVRYVIPLPDDYQTNPVPVSVTAKSELKTDSQAAADVTIVIPESKISKSSEAMSSQHTKNTKPKLNSNDNINNDDDMILVLHNKSESEANSVKHGTIEIDNNTSITKTMNRSSQSTLVSSKSILRTSAKILFPDRDNLQRLHRIRLSDSKDKNLDSGDILFARLRYSTPLHTRLSIRSVNIIILVVLLIVIGDQLL